MAARKQAFTILLRLFTNVIFLGFLISPKAEQLKNYCRGHYLVARPFDSVAELNIAIESINCLPCSHPHVHVVDQGWSTFDDACSIGIYSIELH